MSENTSESISCKTNVKTMRRMWSEMSTKSRIKLFLKLFIIVLCVTGLSFQTTDLVIQYSKRQTVVNVQIETIKYNRLPALTICYPRFLAMDRVLKKFPQLRQQFDEIHDKYENMSDKRILAHHLLDFYENVTHFVESFDLTVIELFELSIPLERTMKSCINPIDIKIRGIRLKTLDEQVVWDTHPIESIVFPNGRQGLKCFTFFHHLNKEMTKYHMDVKEIFIEVLHKNEWFPVQLYEDKSELSMLSFSMHSPIGFPQQMSVNNFLRLKAGKEYEMTYNRWKTVLLEPPYQTDCRKYLLDDKHGSQMRSDCVNLCIDDDLKQKCSEILTNSTENSNNSTECLFRSDVLRRKDSSLDTSAKLCPKFSSHSPVERQTKRNDIKSCIDRNVRHLNSACEKSCQSECLSRFYNYNVITNLKHNITEFHKKGDKLVSIKIAHNQLPDQITEHIPEMTFTQFAANFGGLFGMWLGLSALAILQFLLSPI